MYHKAKHERQGENFLLLKIKKSYLHIEKWKEFYSNKFILSFEIQY